MLQCTSIYRCALFITSKNNINFLFCVHITFFIFYSFFISFSVSLSSVPLHLFFLPSDLLSITDLTSPIADPFLHRQSHKLPTLFSIVDLTSSAATNPSLHRQSHKLSCHKPFSPSPISQAQPPTLFSIADLTSPTATDPSVSLCAHFVSIEKDQATPLALKSGGQY